MYDREDVNLSHSLQANLAVGTTDLADFHSRVRYELTAKVLPSIILLEQFSTTIIR